MKFSKPVLLSAGTLIVAITIFTSAFTESSSNKDTGGENNIKKVKVALDDNSLPQKIKTIYLHDNFNFAGEKVPIEIPDIKERLERELAVNSYYHSSTILNIKRSQRYFPLIDEILTKNNIPTDFKFISVAESNLDNVRSPAGARGFWQLMPSVARYYGLRVDSEVDERYNVEKSTYAACKLILNYKEKFNTWTNAAASYNIGEGNFSKEMKLQKETNYYDMNFGEETNRYIFRVLALKEILTTPERFGFQIGPEQRYTPYENIKIVEVTESIPSLADFAHKHDISYRQLKVHNPWLLAGRLTVKNGQTYEMTIPVKGS
ncbi:lytic transglycosylase domain-containing protein [Membranihabitans maritimus]|uniref:lytic transglycosylase domain-containing protein n=1 Tax=Membranihabitans maritimus TaxID=2904244 RepID=UPI001F3B4449|nr:lytic transglycosylase domain-containing protein [Membranihabitans maritimus]